MKTKKYVLDTNVLISAVMFHNSVPYQAFEKATKSGSLLFSSHTLHELQQVLYRPKFDKYISTENRQFF